MAATVSDNRRIARNTLFLYFRMFIMLAVGLYTSRIVLEALGVTDYGIYNIIGGVVVMFSFLNQALTAATQRYLTFFIGKKDFEKVDMVFCMSMNSYFILSALVLLLGETVGLWFVNTQLNLPADRMVAANWVYQFTLLTFIINLLRIPFHASIIAYERMDFFAYISLIEVVLKLGAAYALFIHGVERLILYAALYTFIPLVVNISYQIYCRAKFTTTRYRMIWDKATFRELFTFSGWSLFGSLANLSAQTGLNILVNIFFGVTVNAAYGIASTVSSHVMQFVSNFQMAFQPQIVKNYAAGKMADLYRLVFRASKFSFYLIFMVSFPLLLVTQQILALWLTEVPHYSAIFCQLLLGFMMIEALSAPLWMTVQATGKIRNYQILMACCIFLNFPITYCVFKLGMAPYMAWLIRIIVNIFTFVVRCRYMKRHVGFAPGEYVRNAIVPIIKVILISAPLPIACVLFLAPTTLNSFIVVCLSVLISIFAIFTTGLDAKEKQLVVDLINKKILHRA